MKFFGILVCILISINAYTQTCCATITNCEKLVKTEARTGCQSTGLQDSKQLQIHVAKIESKSNFMQLTSTLVVSLVSKLAKIYNPKNCDPITCDPSKCDLSKCDPNKCDLSKCIPASCKKS